MIKRLLLIFLPLVLTFSYLNQGYAQRRKFNRRQILKNNKNIRNFRGRKNFFDKSRRYNYFGFSINALNYFGDITPRATIGSTDISFTKPAFGFHVGHRFGPRYTLLGGYTYGTLEGDDAISSAPDDIESRYRYVRNLSFRNQIHEWSIKAIFDLWANEGTYISRVRWTPYIFGGIAVFHHTPQAKVSEASDLPEAGQWVDLQPLGTEGQFAEIPGAGSTQFGKQYKSVQLALTPGIGARLRLNEVLDLSIETGMRYTFTDYLDDVSGNYVDDWVLTSDLARELADRSMELVSSDGAERDFETIDTFTGRQMVENPFTMETTEKIRGYGSTGLDNIRGNSQDFDVYLVTTIKVSYILGGSIRKAKFR